MKHGNFSALIYREYLICKKSLLIAAFSALLFSVMPILFALSFRYGNLAMLPASIVSDIRANHDILLKIFAVITPCMLCMTVAEASIHDIMSKWDCFRRSTPVSPARMALAKYAFYAIVIGISFLLAVIALALFCLAMNISILKTDIAVILLLITAIYMASVVAQVYVMLFRSTDKGMLALIATIAAPIVLLSKESNHFTAESILGFAEESLFLFPVLLAVIWLMGFALTSLLYKRRAK